MIAKVESWNRGGGWQTGTQGGGREGGSSGRVSGKNVVAVCSGWQRLQSRIVDPKIMELLDRGRVTMETWELEFHCVVESQTQAWVVDR